MPPAPIPASESLRLDELRTYDILDTVAEEAYDAITYLAAEICDVPIALISIVDRDRQWFKSRVSLDATETHRELAFCAHAIHQPSSLTIVSDTSADPRFSTNPLVTDDPSIRFYAGAPLVSPAGNALGTLCVFDRGPRRLTPQQEKALAALSIQVMALLELRRTVRDLERKQREVEAATAQRDSFMATVSHEIRGPLTAVIGYVELLRAGLPDDERSEVLASVALPISRLLAEKMGGSLTYRYEVGRSVFELELSMHSE
jgi:GAF domain-containing protein